MKVQRTQQHICKAGDDNLLPSLPTGYRERRAAQLLGRILTAWRVATEGAAAGRQRMCNMGHRLDLTCKAQALERWQAGVHHRKAKRQARLPHALTVGQSC